MLPACIASVRRQTDPHWEHIIVDDGSSDGTPDVARCAAEGDLRVRIIETGGVGRGRALNRGLQEAAGAVVTILDSDDLTHPQRVEVIRALSDELKGYGVITGRKNLLFGSGGPPVWETVVGSMPRVVDITRSIRYGNPISHSGAFSRRDFLCWLGGYDETRSAQFDFDLWIRIVEAGYRLGSVDLALDCKRIHARQSFERRSRLRYLGSSAKLQIRAIRLFSRPRILAYLYLPLRLLRSLLARPLKNLLVARR